MTQEEKIKAAFEKRYPHYAPEELGMSYPDYKAGYLAARNEAFEQAAKACDQQKKPAMHSANSLAFEWENNCYSRCAAAIRELKNDSQ